MRYVYYAAGSMMMIGKNEITPHDDIYIPESLVAMYLTLDILGVTDGEQSVRCCHFGLAMKLRAISAQQLVAVDTFDRGCLQLLPRVFFVVVPDDARGPADLASSAAAGLGSSWRSSPPDDVGQVSDEEVVWESRYAAGWNGSPTAAARARQVAVVRQQEPVRPVLLVHLVVRLEAVGTERVLADEHLGLAVRPRAQPTFEELVVQLLDEVRPNIVAVLPVVKRHGRSFLTLRVSVLFLRRESVNEKWPLLCVATDANAFYPRASLSDYERGCSDCAAFVLTDVTASCAGEIVVVAAAAAAAAGAYFRCL